MDRTGNLCPIFCIQLQFDIAGLIGIKKSIAQPFGSYGARSDRACAKGTDAIRSTYIVLFQIGKGTRISVRVTHPDAHPRCDLRVFAELEVMPAIDAGFDILGEVGVKKFKSLALVKVCAFDKPQNISRQIQISLKIKRILQVLFHGVLEGEIIIWTDRKLGVKHMS